MRCFFFSLSILIVLSSCASLVNPHYIKFEESKQNLAKKQIKNLIIVGMGKLPTRFFLDQITTKLMDDLKRKGINSTYYYLGNDVQKAKRQFDTLSVLNNYDAVMSFFQTDIAEIRGITDYYFLSSPMPLGYMKVVQQRFSQGFNIGVYDPTNLTRSIWESALNIDYNIQDPILYYRISNKIMKSLKKNSLCK